MKQKQYSPLSVAEMAIVIFAADKGYLKEIPVNKIGDFESSLLSYMNSEHGDLMDKINKTGEYNDGIIDSFKAALKKFIATQTW